jgi:hypothetical protein
MRDRNADRSLLFGIQAGLRSRRAGSGGLVIFIPHRDQGKAQHRAAGDRR